jgi:acyl-CoA thioester hydrolase
MSAATDEVTYRGAVYPWHCDHVGHMNVMWYVGKFDEASWNMFARVGITADYLRREQRGMAAVDQHIEYRRELKAGDVVSVRTQLLEFAGKKIRFRHEMRNELTGEVAAVTTLLAVHMDAVARKACPFPAELVRTAAPAVQAETPSKTT